MRYVMVYLVKILYVVFIIVDLVRFVIMINSQFQWNRTNEVFSDRRGFPMTYEDKRDLLDSLLHWHRNRFILFIISRLVA